MQVREFIWEPEEVYGEYFNSDIAEFKRTVSVIRVRAAAGCGRRVVAQQGLTLALYGAEGGKPLKCTPLSRFLDHYKLDSVAFSDDGELLALADGHQVQYVKFTESDFLPTGRLAGERVAEATMHSLCFIDPERCLGVSDRAVLLYERGVCLSQRALPEGPLSLQRDRVLVADRGVLRVHRAVDWEPLDEWPVGPVRALALSAGGRVAWIEDNGFHLREDSQELEVPRRPPGWEKLRLEFAGERLFLRDATGKAWNWRPQAPLWQEWSGPFLGTSGSWWFDLAPDGFRSFCDGAEPAPQTTQRF